MIPFTHSAQKLLGGQQDQGHEVVQHDYREGSQPQWSFILILHILILFWILPYQKQKYKFGLDIVERQSSLKLLAQTQKVIRQVLLRLASF